MNEPLRPIGRLGNLQGLTEKGHILSEQHPDIRRRVVRCTTVQRRTNTGVDPTSILPADQSTSFTVGIPERRGSDKAILTSSSGDRFHRDTARTGYQEVIYVPFEAQEID